MFEKKDEGFKAVRKVKLKYPITVGHVNKEEVKFLKDHEFNVEGIAYGDSSILDLVDNDGHQLRSISLGCVTFL